MRSDLLRRDFLAALGALAGGAIFGPGSGLAETKPVSGKFKLSVISDEISQDLGHALEMVSREFGLGYVELRTLWNKNIIQLDQKEMAEAARLLRKYELHVTDIASPLFKTDWPGAPKSKYSPREPQFGADYTFAEQGEVLERAMAAAKALGDQYSIVRHRD